MEESTPPSARTPSAEKPADFPVIISNEASSEVQQQLNITGDETSFFLPTSSHPAAKDLNDQTMFLGHPDDSFERAMKGQSPDESITDGWRAKTMTPRSSSRKQDGEMGLGVPQVDVRTPFKRANRLGSQETGSIPSKEAVTPQSTGYRLSPSTRNLSSLLTVPVHDPIETELETDQAGPQMNFAPTITIEPPSKRPSASTFDTPRKSPSDYSFGVGTRERHTLGSRSPLKQALQEGRALSPRSTPTASSSVSGRGGRDEGEGIIEKRKGSPLAQASMQWQGAVEPDCGSKREVEAGTNVTPRKEPLGEDHQRDETLTGRKRKGTFFSSPLRSMEATRGGRETDDCAWMRSTSNPNLAAIADGSTEVSPKPRVRAGSSPNLSGLLAAPSSSRLTVEQTTEGETEGNKSGYLPDTPGIRKHAALLGEEYGLLGEDMSFGLIGNETRVIRSEERMEPVLSSPEEQKSIPESKQAVAREVIEANADESFCLDMGMKSYIDLMADNGDDMRAALDKVDMTMIGDETRAGDDRVRLAVPTVSKRKGMGLRVGMSPVMEVPTPIQPAMVDVVQPTGQTLKIPPPRFQHSTTSTLPSGTDTLDLKFALQCMPKDMYGVGKDGKPEWRGDISVSELLKEDNPFIATAEEKERASRRSRLDGQPKFLTNPPAPAAASRLAPGQSLRNIFASESTEASVASPTKRREEREIVSEVERELDAWSKETAESRLRFRLDPALSVEGKKRIEQQARGDETRGTKLQAWEDAKRWMFVLDNLAWVKKMDAAGLFKPDQLERVLKIVYDEAPTESGPGVRCPATPTFVRDARRLYPAATVGRTHRRSASMDPVQLGLAASSRVSSSVVTASIGHRRNVSMDPAQAMSVSGAALRTTTRLTSRPTAEAPKPGTMGSGISRYGNVVARSSSIAKRSSPTKPGSTVPTTREPIKSRSTADPTLRQSRTRTTGTSADQVLASMGIREPMREARRPAISALSSTRASTSSGIATRTRTTTTVMAGQRATTTASTVISRGRTESSMTAAPVRSRMTQPSASGLSSRNSADPLGLGGSKTRLGAVSSTGAAGSRGTASVRPAGTRARE